jgi:hypothetical protein
MGDVEAIQNTVERYFGQRYLALSGKAMTGFELLCTGKEMEKALGRFRAEVDKAVDNGLTYRGWNMKLDFVTIKVRCGKARVEVKERHSVVYDIARDTVSTMRGLLHGIRLKKRGDAWYITGHDCRDEQSLYRSRRLLSLTGLSRPRLLLGRMLSNGHANKGRAAIRGLDGRHQGEAAGRLYRDKYDRSIRLGVYDRDAAVAYAHRWALDRNPKYYDFENLGGDCTNFCSQVLYAGGCPMNDSKGNGWYYYSLNNRAPAWTGVEFFYRFVTGNRARGPQGRQVSPSDIRLGDFIQLNFSDGGAFDHCLVVVANPEPGNLSRVLISCHTVDRDNYPLTFYDWKEIRFIHINGYGM